MHLCKSHARSAFDFAHSENYNINMQCPVCIKPLKKMLSEQGVLWTCDTCKGCAVGIGLLQNFCDQKLIGQLWSQIQKENRIGKRKCPDCHRKMHLIQGGQKVQNIELDACSNCMFFWFDAEEVGKFPRVSEAEVERRNTEAALRKVSNEHELEKLNQIFGHVNQKTGRAEKFTQGVVNEAVSSILISVATIYLKLGDE